MPDSHPVSDGVEVTTPLASLKANGRDTVLVVLVAIQVVATVWGVTENHRKIDYHIGMSSAEHMVLVNNDRIIACILSLPPNDRDYLRKEKNIAWELWCPGYMKMSDDPVVGRGNFNVK